MPNPIDIFFGIIQGIAAALLIFRINSLPDILVYFLAAMLIISGIIDLFSI
ncbi:MAG: hypothetical protein QW818_00890 [Candidatus Aenigmatarchaeota archaeon]|nr:hypothetical protein [Candidatus Aenigmarchaeota archaeon]